MLAVQARVRPSTVALSSGGKFITYDMLEALTNQLAHHLMTRGIRAERRVAICMERGIDTILALVGVIKTGAAYIAMDPMWPPSRLANIISESDPRMIIIDERGPVKASSLDGLPHLVLPTAWPNIQNESMNSVWAHYYPKQLFAIMYTSGTTGRARGVMVCSEAVMNQLAGMRMLYPFRNGDKALIHRSYSVIGSLWDQFGAMVAGVPSVVATEREAQDPTELVNVLRRNRVTHLAAAPQLLAILCESRAIRMVCPSVRLIVTGGDFLATRVRSGSPEVFPRALVINCYATTETSYLTQRVYGVGEYPSARSSVGAAFYQSVIYILNERLESLPTGTTGDIYASGVGLARGYSDQASATAVRFVADAYSGNSGRRLYRTGDIGFLDSAGNLEVLGRRDNQVKIRGFRVELEEVECVLCGAPAVLRAAVIARRNYLGDNRLIAYVVTCDHQLKADALRRFLRNRLPRYMVPTRFIKVEALPLTSTGKVDRARLAARDGGF
jgi:amino acid adenylation domain-containing protein